jgi:hypothetical protein
MRPDDSAVIYPENKTIGVKTLNYFAFIQTSYIDSQQSFEARITWLEWVNLNRN